MLVCFLALLMLSSCVDVQWGILRSTLNIPRLSLENLDRQIQNSQSELNGTSKLTYELICQARFSALVSMCIPLKVFIA